LQAVPPRAMSPPAQNRMEPPPCEKVQHLLAPLSVQSVPVEQRRKVWVPVQVLGIVVVDVQFAPVLQATSGSPLVQLAGGEPPVSGTLKQHTSPPMQSAGELHAKPPSPASASLPPELDPELPPLLPPLLPPELPPLLPPLLPPELPPLLPPELLVLPLLLPLLLPDEDDEPPSGEGPTLPLLAPLQPHTRLPPASVDPRTRSIVRAFMTLTLALARRQATNLSAAQCVGDPR
jgi:hypothetical protein